MLRVYQHEREKKREKKTHTFRGKKQRRNSTPTIISMNDVLCKCIPGYYRRIEEKDEEIIDEPCNLLSSANFALVCAYFSVGFVGSLLRTPLNVYLVHTLSAEPEIQNTIGILQTLPWSYKLPFGFVSDAVPIYG